MVDSLGQDTETLSRDNLFAGSNHRPITRSVTLEMGNNVVRGHVLGKVKYSVGTPVPSGVGDGTMTAVTAGADLKLGNYVATCIATAVDGGTFEVVDPEGHTLPDAEVGTPYVNDQIEFTINDGGTDFSLNDTFTIPVTAGNGKYNESVAAALDGTEDPVSISAEDMDATAEDKTIIIYVAGEFNENALTYGAGHSADSVRDVLEARSIYLKAPVKSF